MGRIRRALSIATVACTMAAGLASASLLGGQVAGASQSPSGSPVIIGLVGSFTGPLSSTSVDIPAVYKAWASSVNASGGINGHPVQVISKDDQSSPGNSISIVQNFVQSDHVIAIVDATNVDQAWAAYVQQQAIPVIGMVTSTQPMFTNSAFYPEGQTENSLFVGIVGAVKKAKATKMALFYCAEAAQCQEGIAPLKQQAARSGVDVVATVEVSASSPSFAAQCLAAKQAGAQAVFLADAQSINNKIAADCTKQGYNPTYVIDGEDIVGSMTKVPGLSKNTYLTVPNIPYFAKTSAIRQMNAALDKYAPGVRSHATYGEFPAEAWMAGKLLQEAAQTGHLGQNGSAPTAAQLAAGLHNLGGTTLNGMASPLQFAAGQPHPVNCWYWTVIKNGKFQTPYGLAPACASTSK